MTAQCNEKKRRKIIATSASIKWFRFVYEVCENELHNKVRQKMQVLPVS